MSKKKNKKDKQLRREIEVLKAQLKTDSKKGSKSKNQIYSESPLENDENLQTKAKVDNSGKEKSDRISKNSNYSDSTKKEVVNISQDEYVKKDLVKTFILSLIAFAIIFSLWLLTVYNVKLPFYT